MEDIKEYPGSSFGPNPEDNPRHYFEWWEANKPKFLKPKTVEESLELDKEMSIEYGHNPHEDPNAQEFNADAAWYRLNHDDKYPG
jgi:NTP pyrophosphatase (non-canonical NTP hydrolase)